MKFALILLVCLVSLASSYEEAANLFLLSDAAINEGAVCLDGSPAGYYFRPGTGSGAKKWLLHLMGGGWCFGAEDCYNRSSTIFGSSKNWTSTHTFHGALSSDEAFNPAFYNWNMVFFMYCDGASFSADRAQPDVYMGKTLYFRGLKNLKAIMDDLNNHKDLKQATDVVLTGCSAGGLAVYMHMNYIQTLIPPSARYSGLPDAGFFLDIPGYRRNSLFSTYFAFLIRYMDIDSGLMAECKSDYSEGELFKCMYAPYIYKYIKAPLLVLNSRYDTAQLNGLFNLPCLPPDCDADETQYFHDFETFFNEQVGVVKNSNVTGSGYFLDSCFVHCQTMDDHPWSSFKVGGKSMSQAVYDWYYNSAQTRLDDCDYPCNPTCPGKYPPKFELQ